MSAFLTPVRCFAWWLFSRGGSEAMRVVLPLLTMAPLLAGRGSAFMQWARATGSRLASTQQCAWTRPKGIMAMSSSVQVPKGYVSPETRLQNEEAPKAKPWDYVAFHPSYQLLRQDAVDEYGAKVAIYKHKKSGAQVMSVGIDDENKVFGITFRTPPADSTGVPHILEHSVLCGSRKFPVKEPFVDLLKGSLNTFLNAFTYPDRTCYPVASQNTKDFYNLIHVYLDAVLHPRALNDPLVLQQEGWHYELEDKSQPLTYKGVVYNEMKGVYSSPDSLMNRATQQELFPDNTYGVDSGGDPWAIPNLTFEGFKNFHQSYYHPSNARVYFYGDDDPMARLDLLDEYLREFDVNDVDSSIKFQKKKDQPWKYSEAFPATEVTKDKGMVSVNWLLNDSPLPLKEQLGLAILNHILMGSSASFLYKRLIQSGLGESVIGGGLSDELLQNTFSVGLKGVKVEDYDKVEKLVIQILEEVTKEGLPKEAIDASVNSVEFSLREFNTGSFPRGLSFMLGAMQYWLYDRDPLDGLRFEKPLKELKQDLTDGKPVFEELIKKYILSNGHRLTVEMKPDVSLEEKQQKAEESKLAEIKASMSDEQLEKVIQATATLKAAQAAEDSPEAKATIPRLSLADLDKEQREIPIEVEERKGITVLKHVLPTNGILYVDVGFNVRSLPLEDLPLLPLFLRCLLETGTSKMDEIQLIRRIGTHTGGLRTASRISYKAPKGGVVTKSNDLVSHAFLRGKAVESKVGELYKIMNEVLTDANLDNQKRVLEMLKESKARYRSAVVGAGNSFASTRLSARYSLPGLISEMTEGITYMQNLDQLIEQAEKDWPALRARLEKIRDAIVRRGGMILNLTGDEALLVNSNAQSDEFIDSIPTAPTLNYQSTADWGSSSLLDAKNEGFAVPTQVNYVVKGGPLWMPGERISGSSSVVNRFLRSGYLWDNVRVMGGAYGGFCNYSPYSGLFTFGSYRDPNLSKTLAIYDAAAEELINGHVSQEELSMTIIGAVGDLDSPMSPDQKGYASMMEYLEEETPEDRQRWRDEVLSTSVSDFKAFGERLKELTSKRATSSVVGSKKALADANAELPADQQMSITDLL